MMIMNDCPNCNGPLSVAVKACGACGLEIRGKFEENPLFALSREEQDFLLQFVLSSGNFKALGERLDLTYPTLRSRLDRIIAKLEASPDGVLGALESGDLSPEQAIQQLRRMTGREGCK